MDSQNNNSKRIVTNTVVLYIRMFIVMLISLYSSRIVLKALGVDDFGLFSVVGGVVALMTFLQSSLASSTQRFLSFELGKNNVERTKAVFRVSLTTHIAIAVIIILIAETVGLWFLNAKVNIPEGRIFAANVVYQLSVLSLTLSMIALPYYADIISREKMSYFAVVGIVEAVFKLGFAFMLLILDYDKLILYAFLVFILSLLVNISYWIYCRVKFYEARFKLSFDKILFKEIFSFSGWTIIGQMAVVGVSYGTGIVVNQFFPVAVNAAMGIANQVNGSITGLTSNFQTAFQPQITKSYASKDYDYMSSLIYYSSKISFFLLFIVTLPIMMNIDIILSIWLTIVPEYSNWFCILFIIASTFNALSAPLWIVIFATGRIKVYQIVVSCVFFSDLIIVYILYSFGFPPITCMVVKAAINFFVIFVRMFYARKEVEVFSVNEYLRRAFMPCMLAMIITVVPCISIFLLCDTILLKLIVTSVTVLFSLFVAYYIGLEQHERKAAVSLILNYIHKKR